MSKKICLPLLSAVFVMWIYQTNAQDSLLLATTSPLNIGEGLTIQSHILDEERRVNVYLPYGYSKDSVGKYPVIYLLDGSMDEDFIHIAGLVQFGSFPWIKMLPESVIIGIANIDRKKDFTFPTNNAQDQIDFPTTGGSAKFIQFIEEELQPIVNSNYSVNATQTLIGQSMGGLLATEILFKKPDLFDNYIIVSPSLWWDNESLLRYDDIQNISGKKIYVAVGKEGEIMERSALTLYTRLNEEFSKDNTIFYKFLEARNHGDALHLAVYSAFEAIFKKSK